MARVGLMKPTENGQDDTGANKVWYRCSRCHHNILFDEETLAALKESAESKSLSKEQCTHYSPEKSFNVGEAIYHTEWDDMGWVKDKQRMSDGRSAIIVTFQKLGERKLIDSFRPNDVIDAQGGEV
jgi:hypothetical protein